MPGSGSEPPPPPITVSIPGRGEAPAELLAVGPALERVPRRLPRREIAVGALAGAVLLSGVGVSYQRLTAPPPPAPIRVAPTITGVTARTTLAPGGDRFTTPLNLSVELAAVPNRGDSGSPTAQDMVALVGARLAGFSVMLAGGGFPRPLGPVTRDAQTVQLRLLVSVQDCSVNVFAPRALRLRLQRGTDPAAPVLADAGQGVARALDDLVRFTCRRPRL